MSPELPKLFSVTKIPDLDGIILPSGNQHSIRLIHIQRSKRSGMCV
jgi:hypothetical protein